MSITVNNGKAGGEDRIGNLIGCSGAALDWLWQQSWIKDSIGGSPEGLREVQAIAEELAHRCDRIIVIASGGIGRMISAGLRAFSAPDEEQKVIAFGRTLSADDYATLLTSVEELSIGMIAVAAEPEDLAQKAACATVQKLLTDRYGSGGAGRRTVWMASGDSEFVREEGRAGGAVFRQLADDTTAYMAANTEAMILPLMAAGIDGQEYDDGFREMLSSTWWDADADRYSLYLADRDEEDILCWQSELFDLAAWLAGAHRSAGIDSRPLLMPWDGESRRLGRGFATQILCERERSDIMLPPFPGAGAEGSLNFLMLEELERVRDPELQAVMHGAFQDTAQIAMSEITPYEFGQMMAFLQISAGITGYIRSMM